jgi:hypothetical protein
MMLAALLPLRIVDDLLLRRAGQGASKPEEQGEEQGAEPEDARVTGV